VGDACGGAGVAVDGTVVDVAGAGVGVAGGGVAVGGTCVGVGVGGTGVGLAVGFEVATWVTTGVGVVEAACARPGAPISSAIINARQAVRTRWARAA